MELTKNEILIIKVLLYSNEYVSSYDISSITGINQRKIREEMIQVKKILSQNHLTLISTTSKGYFLVKNSNEYLSFIEFIKKVENNTTDNLLSSPHERTDFITTLFINRNDYIKIDDLADMLFISPSTCYNDLLSIKKNLKKYNISFQKKAKYGLKIVGKEIDKRKVLADSIFQKLCVSQALYDFIDTFKVSNDNQILQYIQEYNIPMSDIGLVDFLVCLSITTERISKNHTLTKPSNDFFRFQDINEYLVATKIASFISNNLQIEFNDYEIQNITILLLLKKSINIHEQCNDAHIISIASEVTKEIYSRTMININNSSFIKILKLYIKYALLRIEFNEKIRTPLYQEIKYSYPLAYDFAKITSQTIYKTVRQKMSSSELALFTSFYNDIISTTVFPKKKVLLINSIGENSLSFCNQIYQRLSDYIDIKKCIQYYEIDAQNLSNYDFIISTIPIHKEYCIPNITINYSVSKLEIDKINSFLINSYKNNNILYYFHPEYYKFTTITYMKDILRTFYKMIKDENLISINEAEKTLLNASSIKQYNQFAILHYKKPIVSQKIIGIIHMSEAISYDNKKIKIAFFIPFKDDNNMAYNILCNILDRLSHHEDDIQKLLNAKNYISLLNVLIKYF